MGHSCAKYEKEALDKIQNEAGRIAIGATKQISIPALYNEIKLETLSQRREEHISSHCSTK